MEEKNSQNGSENRKQNASQDINQLKKVRRDKLEALQEAGQDPFQITSYPQTHHSSEVKEQYDALKGEKDEEGNWIKEPVTIHLAGRLMSKRVMGKASFAHIQDKEGQIQIYVSRNDLGDENYASFKKLDIGDIVGVKGFAFTTKTGEITIHAMEMTLLSKSLEPLPEKFHGLQDVDLRYRQRYTDLIMNEGVRDTFKKRSQIVQEIRNFLSSRDFIEVETPILVSNAGGAAAKPFVTHYNALDEDVKLRISFELYLKRLLVGGMEKVYEIGRAFRNEGVDARHNPEFTLLELYQAYTDYNGMMELTEAMFRHLARTVCGSDVVVYGETKIDFSIPFRRVTITQEVKEETGIDFDAVKTDEEAKEIARAHGIEFEEQHKKGDILHLFFDEYCESKLIQPTFVTDYPTEISPLTKRKADDPSKVERFEFFINGWEMGNAYSELNDPIDQRERFAAQDAASQMGENEGSHADEDFLHAMEIGMPPAGGVGFGVDRIVMLLTNSSAIRDVLLFPTMKQQE